MADEPTIEGQVAEYVASLVGRPVDPLEPIISSSLLESLAAVELIDFVEITFGIVIDDDDLVLSNFDSVQAIVALVTVRIPAE